MGAEYMGNQINNRKNKLISTKEQQKCS